LANFLSFQFRQNLFEQFVVDDMAHRQVRFGLSLLVDFFNQENLCG